MSRLIRICIAFTICCLGGIAYGEESRPEVIVSADRLEDQIHGGMLGQILGNLNGLPHEMKYIGEPGNVERYVPALPEGARTDDDTDLEWVYITEMQKSGRLYVPEERIVELWKAHVNRGIWCANLYSRKLMDFDRRRRSGFGTFRTSEEIGRRGPNVKLSQLLQDVLGVQVERRGPISIVTMMRGATTGIGRTSCVPSLFVDGILDRTGEWDAYYANEISGIEVYVREAMRPFEFIDPQNPCGAVAIWTRIPPKKPNTH